MKNTKTLRDYYNDIMNIVKGADITEDRRAEAINFIEGRIELLNKKNSKSGEPTPEQRLNADLEQVIAEILNTEPEKPFSATEITKVVNARVDGVEVNVQRIVYILTKMSKTDKTIYRVTKSGKAFYRATEPAED